MPNARRLNISAFAVLILLVGLSFAQSQDPKKLCDATLSMSDWRIVMLMGLGLSSAFVALLYIYGSVLDGSFKQKAKNEFYQLIVTATIAVMFGSIVTFMCGSTLSDLLGLGNKGTYEVANSYLSDLLSYTKSSFTKVATFSVIVEGGTGLDTMKAGKSGRLLQGLIASTDYFKESISALFTTVLSAYMMTLMQMQLLDFIQVISLTVFLPAGIVLRSIFFTRKFGGALIGAAIAFYISVPFLLMVNKVMVDPFFAAENSTFSCMADSECYSHNCNLTAGKCVSMSQLGGSCANDFQCATGYCGSNGKCSECGVLDETGNPNCCQGLSWGGTKCSLAKLTGNKCQADKECVSWFCDKSGSPSVCSALKVEGSCNNDKECFSRHCAGIAPNKGCVDTIRTEEDQLQMQFTAASMAQAGADPESSQAFLLGGQPAYTAESGVDTRITQNPSDKSFINRMFDAFVGSIIAGIFLPAINIIFISRAVRDMSEFLGNELDIASIWKVI